MELDLAIQMLFELQTKFIFCLREKKNKEFYNLTVKYNYCAMN